eukprot:gene4665-850_t
MTEDLVPSTDAVTVFKNSQPLPLDTHPPPSYWRRPSRTPAPPLQTNPLAQPAFLEVPQKVTRCHPATSTCNPRVNSSLASSTTTSITPSADYDNDSDFELPMLDSSAPLGEALGDGVSETMCTTQIHLAANPLARKSGDAYPDANLSDLDGWEIMEMASVKTTGLDVSPQGQ